MRTIECTDSGSIYKNPLPHVYSKHAYFPSTAVLPKGEMVAAYSIGQAFESIDLHTHLSRSLDGGKTWAQEGRVLPDTEGRTTSDCCRISLSPKGELVAFLIRHDRSRSNQGLTNPQNLGFVETELLLLRSTDRGKTWNGPEVIDPPITSPSFEMNSPIIFLDDGRWLLPTSTWRGWNGECPNGMKMVAFVSYDEGKTWPEYMDVMADTENQRIFWESRVLQLSDGRLLATAWTHDEKNGTDRENSYTVSNREGNAFGAVHSTGIKGQTLSPYLLEDGSILSVYRRLDKEGLWANISRLEGERGSTKPVSASGVRKLRTWYPERKTW